VRFLSHELNHSDQGIIKSAYPQKSSNPDENRLYEFYPNRYKISVGAHSCAMHSRLKAAPTIALSEREVLRCVWVRTSLKEVTIVLGVNGRITDKQINVF